MVDLVFRYPLLFKNLISSSYELPTPKEVVTRCIDKQIILHTGREDGNLLYIRTKLTEYSTPPKGTAFTLNDGAFIDMTMSVTNRKLP